jgi:protein-L-isoaspartate(D-aspartate) O-methyltransferase
MPNPFATDLDYDYFVTEPDATTLPQSTAKGVIHDIVGLLDLEPGHRVLEVGTGSGYSAALIAAYVGSHGEVVSLDIDAALVARARAKHAALGTGVELHDGDGAHGWPDRAPFDRIVAWATPSLLPGAWIEQANENAIIVTPIKAAPVAVANVVVRCSIRDGKPTRPTLHAGSFIEMHDRVITELGVPVECVDAVHRGPDEQPAWLSCPALRDGDTDPQDLLGRLLADRPTVKPDPFDGDRRARDGFFAFLYASQPRELGSAGIGGGWGLGAVVPDGAALIRPSDVVVLGAGSASDVLDIWLAEWRSAGRLGLSDLGTSFRAAAGGWEVRPVMRQPTDA